MIRPVTSPQLPFWLLTIAVLTGLTLPVLVQDGMFMDAMLYTSVSHNLSLGIGTFWFPQFSEHNVAGLNAFHEQPPLVFGIQAVFFRLLGSSMYVERFYTFVTLVLSAILIARLWREICRGNKYLSESAWLPVLFWITTPVCFWSYSNNMHENTMGIFCLLAVLHLQRASGTTGYYIHSVWAGIFIFLATFSKGVPGFFPVAVPLLHYFIVQKKRLGPVLISTALLISVPLLIYLVLWLFPASRESLGTYFFKRALHRMNELPTVDSRFYIAGRLFMELLPQILLLTTVALISRIKNWRLKLFANPHAWFYFAVGLAASAPMLLTKVQKGFYLVPSFPYFAIAFALFVGPALLKKRSMPAPGTASYRMWLVAGLSALVIATGMTISFFGKTSRNAALLGDVYKVGAVVPEGSVISIPEPLWNRWDLQCYLMRYFQISLHKGAGRPYYLYDRTLPEGPPENYSKVALSTEIYDLYRTAP